MDYRRRRRPPPLSGAAFIYRVARLSINVRSHNIFERWVQTTEQTYGTPSKRDGLNGGGVFPDTVCVYVVNVYKRGEKCRETDNQACRKNKKEYFSTFFPFFTYIRFNELVVVPSSILFFSSLISNRCHLDG